MLRSDLATYYCSPWRFFFAALLAVGYNAFTFRLVLCFFTLISSHTNNMVVNGHCCIDILMALLTITENLWLLSDRFFFCVLHFQNQPYICQIKWNKLFVSDGCIQLKIKVNIRQNEILQLGEFVSSLQYFAQALYRCT